MELEQKHMRENNRVCMIVSSIIQVFMLGATVMYKSGRPFISTTLMIVIEILCIVITVVGYAVLGRKRTCHYPLLLSLAVSYMMVLLGSMHIPYMYAFGVLIGIDVVLFSDTQITAIAAVTAIVENLIYVFIYYYGISHGLFERDSTHNFMIPTNTGFIALFAIICVMVVKISSRHNGEIMDDIRKRAAEQLDTAKKGEETAKKIAEKLEDADKAMISLSEKVNSSAEAVSQISSSVALTAEAVQTQTRMNSNIEKSLENISSKSKTMLELSVRVKDNISDGNDIITNLTRQSEETAVINSETASKTQELADAAETVKSIVNTILSISSQTNLLALNASIEAARAGEAGRGFAVVAEEIRHLSEDTKASAEQISVTIDALIDSVGNASANMKKSVESANIQGRMIGETGNKFGEILESVNTLIRNVEEISQNVSSCAEATTTVMDSISNLSASSEQVAASSEASLSLSKECQKDMETTNEILGDILKLSRNEG